MPIERPTKLHLQSYNYTVSAFLEVYEKPLYILDPPYQRGSLWDRTKKQNLLLSLVRGIPTGAIVINKRPYDKRADYAVGAVVDGRQRLEAIRDFFTDRLEVPALWFDDDMVTETCGDIEYQGEMTPGVIHSGLSKKGQLFFQMRPMPTVEASVRTVQEEAELYALVNFGGVEQTDLDLQRSLEVQDVPVVGDDPFLIG